MKSYSYYVFEKDIDKHIISYFKKYRLKELSQKIFLIWRENIEGKHLSFRTKSKLHNQLCKICDCLKYFGINKNYEREIGNFKKTTQEKEEIHNLSKIRYISQEQYQKFISCIEDNLWKTFFAFLYYTGMRRGEVLALNWNDIDFEKREIFVTKNLCRISSEGKKITSTKTGKNRKVSISNGLLETLKKYYDFCSKQTNFEKNDFVFGGKKTLSCSTIDRKKHEYFALADVSEITIHEFRHSHVSLLINEAVKQNMDVGAFFVIMSERMGHTIEVMQRTYMHLFPDIQKPIINLLDNL